jgi:hypothetical protein
MDVPIISELIGNVGFPIAVCIALFWQNNQTIKAFQELRDIAIQNGQATKSIEKMQDIIDDNTDAVKHLSSILQRKE